MSQTLPGHATYPDVFKPITLNRLSLRNRLFVPAHTTNFGEHHLPSQRHVDYHRERARGGVGAIIFEAIRVMDNTLGRPQGVSGYLPGAVEAVAAVAQAVHAEGAALIAQICHMGRQIDGEFERTVSVSASDLRWSLGATHPRALDRQGMDEVRDAHVRVALNMVAAGMDGIEHFHGLDQAHGAVLTHRCTHADIGCGTRLGLGIEPSDHAGSDGNLTRCQRHIGTGRCRCRCGGCRRSNGGRRCNGRWCGCAAWCAARYADLRTLADRQLERAEFQLQVIKGGMVKGVDDAADLPHFVFTQRDFGFAHVD